MASPSFWPWCRPADLAVARGDTAALPNLPISDCGIQASGSALWHVSGLLDAAAEQWARGTQLSVAVERSGYAATAVSGLRFYGLETADRPRFDAGSCRVLSDRTLTDAGMFRRGDELWLVFAGRAILPNPKEQGPVAGRALSLVNAARAEDRRCGNRTWPRAEPVRLSAQLSEIARQHALDMARRHYFDHVDPDGRTPADRVRAAGYREQRVGENLAYGTLSTEEAIAGWLKSPGHCENVMDPLFKEMGIAFAQDGKDPSVLYWVQLFVDPL